MNVRHNAHSPTASDLNLNGGEVAGLQPRPPEGKVLRFNCKTNQIKVSIWSLVVVVVVVVVVAAPLPPPSTKNRP